MAARDECRVVVASGLVDQLLGIILIAVLTSGTPGQVDLQTAASVAGLAIVFLGVVSLFGERVAGVLGRLASSLTGIGARVHTPHTFSFLFEATMGPVTRALFRQIERA